MYTRLFHRIGRQVLIRVLAFVFLLILWLTAVFNLLKEGGVSLLMCEHV